jgi:hypothetical protein
MRSFEKYERRGLPGGPNEITSYMTGAVSVQGYKSNSPDRYNDFNLIPSGNITMKDVDFPVFGMDNLGNMAAMMPGIDYKFPGSMVFELPMAQGGKETIQVFNDYDNPVEVFRDKVDFSPSLFDFSIEDYINNPYNRDGFGYYSNAIEDAYDRAYNWNKDWLNSAMYDEMLAESISELDSRNQIENERQSQFDQIDRDDQYLYFDSDSRTGGASALTANHRYPQMTYNLYHPALYAEENTDYDMLYPIRSLQAQKLFADKLADIMVEEIGHSTLRPKVIKGSNIDRYMKSLDIDERINLYNNAITIPDSDRELISSLVNSQEESGLMQDSYDYITDFGEVRERLNRLRFAASEGNIYDPLNEKATMRNLLELKDTRAFKDLEYLYDDDEILQLLNSISQAEPQQDVNELPMAQFGLDLGLGDLYDKAKDALSGAVSDANKYLSNKLEEATGYDDIGNLISTYANPYNYTRGAGYESPMSALAAEYYLGFPDAIKGPQDYTKKAADKDDAFAQAREELGPGKSFIYDAVRYTTDYYGQTEDPNTKNVLGMLEEGIGEDYDQATYDRFIEVWNQMGQPPLNYGADYDPGFLAGFSPSFQEVSSLAGSIADQRTEPTPHVNPITSPSSGGNIYVTEDKFVRGDNPTDYENLMEWYVKELSHSKQLREQGRFDFVTDYVKDLFHAHGDQLSTYKTPGTVEHEAHEILEKPMLEYVFGTSDYKYGGGVLPKAQQGFEIGDDANLTDFVITTDDLETLNKQVYNDEGDNINPYACDPNKGCLASAFDAYDLLVGQRHSQFPTEYDIKGQAQIQSAGNIKYDMGSDQFYSNGSAVPRGSNVDNWVRGVPYFKGRTDGYTGQPPGQYDYTADSWDIHGILVSQGGTSLLTGQNSFNNLSPEEKANLYSQMTPGTIVGFGRSSDDNGGYNNDMGLADATHSTIVVGYAEDGVPILYDYGIYRRLDDNPQFYGNNKYMTNITVPSGVAGKNIDYLKREGMYDMPISDFTANMDKVYEDSDRGSFRLTRDRYEMKPFYNSLQSNKNSLMHDLKLSDEEYNWMAKSLIGIAMQESGGGTATEYTGSDVFFDMNTPGADTHGLTQLNWNNIEDDYQLKRIAEKYDITKASDLMDPEKAAIASMIYGYRNLAVSRRNYDKGVEPGVRTFKPGYDWKDALREGFQGARVQYPGPYFITEDNKRIDFEEEQRNYSSFGTVVAKIDRDIEDIQADFDRLYPPGGDGPTYRVKKKDGKIIVEKMTVGNNPELTDQQKFIYNWNNPGALRTGDAGGLSRYLSTVEGYANDLRYGGTVSNDLTNYYTSLLRDI